MGKRKADQEEKVEKVQPVMTCKAPVGGGVLELAIWANQVQTERGEMTVHNVTLSRSYKDKENVWQKTSGVRASDLPVLALLCQRAWNWVLDNKEEPIPI